MSKKGVLDYALSIAFSSIYKPLLLLKIFKYPDGPLVSSNPLVRNL